MSIKLALPNITELKPRISVIGVGGAGGNAINNMIAAGVEGVDFIVANTDAQALAMSSAETIIQLGTNLTEGLGAGARPEVGESAAEEAIDELKAQLSGSHMVFVAAGMGGGTGTGAAPVIARAAHELKILTVGVVTKPFHFEGNRRMRMAEAGIIELAKHVDTLIVIPNQNLFRIANEKTTFAEAFVLADQVLHAGIACVTDLMVREGLINLDFADVRAVMLDMGTAMMGTGEAAGDRRALEAAELAITNPLLDEISMKGAKGLLVSISGSTNMTLYEVDEAASRVREEVDPDANIIVGATFDDTLGDKLRVSIVASGLAGVQHHQRPAGDAKQAEVKPAAAQPDAKQPAPQLPEPARATQKPSAPGDARSAAGARPAPRQTQRAADFTDDDITIELGPPKSMTNASAPAGKKSTGPAGHDGQRDRAPDNRGAQGAFAPQAPAPVKSVPPRMPDLEAFPPHAQREYRAKSEGQAPDQPIQRKRASLFDRLTGRGVGDDPREPTESRAPVSPGQTPNPGKSATPGHAPSPAHRQPTPAPQQGAAPEGSHKDTEIPAFFRRQGGSGNG